jgi:hypothetical protein
MPQFRPLRLALPPRLLVLLPLPVLAPLRTTAERRPGRRLNLQREQQEQQRQQRQERRQRRRNR